MNLERPEMRRIAEYSAFGFKYRFKELSAVDSFRLLLNDIEMEVEPMVILDCADASVYDESTKQWIQLDTRDKVNACVKDVASCIANYLVLNGLLLLIREQNIGFLINNQWKPLKIPSRLKSSVDPVVLDHIDPIIGTLVANHLATLRELQEFYSLKDAFDMFDVYSADSLSKALASDAVISETKRT